MTNRYFPSLKRVAGRLQLAGAGSLLILLSGCSSGFFTGSEPLLDGWLKSSDHPQVQRAGSRTASEVDRAVDRAVDRVASASHTTPAGDPSAITSRTSSAADRPVRRSLKALIRGEDAARGSAREAPISYNVTRWVPLIEEEAANRRDEVQPVSYDAPEQAEEQAAPARESTQLLVNRARAMMARRLAGSSE